MLSDIRAPKSKRAANTISKSNTALSLPGISHPMKYCRTDRMAKNPSYLQSINSISENVEYSDKNTVYLTKQQLKLKDMLKKMNSDTLHMIDLIKPKRNVNKVSKEEMALITDRQIDNSKKNISTMQAEIEKLQAKYNRIVQQMEEEDLINKIREIKADIESIKSGNTNMKFNIDKDGKEIVREYSEGYDAKLTILENDCALLDKKLERLKNENIRAVEQNSNMLNKTKQVNRRIESCQDQYQKAKSSLISQTISKNLQATFKERRHQSQAVKKKMNFQNNHLQYKYYKLLKELQAQKITCEGLSIRQDSLTNKIANAKEQIVYLEDLNNNLRRQKQAKSKNVHLFLQNERKNRQQAEKNSMLISSRLDSRQQLIPHTMSLCEPNMNQGLNQPSFEEASRKWQSQSNKPHAAPQIEHHTQQKIQVVQIDSKEEADKSTIQLRKGQQIIIDTTINHTDSKL